MMRPTSEIGTFDLRNFVEDIFYVLPDRATLLQGPR